MAPKSRLKSIAARNSVTSFRRALNAFARSRCSCSSSSNSCGYSFTSEPPRKEREKARGQHCFFEAGALVHPQKLADQLEPAAMRKYSVEEEPAQEAREQRALVILLDLASGRFDQAPVLDSGRARRLAG